jgi:hypothetical protein
MEKFTIELVDPGKNYIEIETFFGNMVNNLEIERSSNFNIEIINTEKILASDLPDDIPMSKIVGTLNVARIEGLDDYLDSYEFDCGSP